MFVERIVKRRILNMDEALSKCRSWTPPQASGFTHTECGVINTDNGSHWKQHMAIMQTVDVLVGAHIGVLRQLVDTEGGREGTLILGLPLAQEGSCWSTALLWLPVRTEGRCRVTLVMWLLLEPKGCRRQLPVQLAPVL